MKDPNAWGVMAGVGKQCSGVTSGGEIGKSVKIQDRWFCYMLTDSHFVSWVGYVDSGVMGF